MPMRPLSCTDDGCRNIQPASSSSSTGRTNASRPRSPPTVYALMVCATSDADEEPLDDGAGDREQHEEEREAVAALILLERLGSERAEQPAGRVREAQPGAHDERRLVRLADVALGGGRAAGVRRRASSRGGASQACPSRARDRASGRTRPCRQRYGSSGDISAERRGSAAAPTGADAGCRLSAGA